MEYKWHHDKILYVIYDSIFLGVDALEFFAIKSTIFWIDDEAVHIY